MIVMKARMWAKVDEFGSPSVWFCGVVVITSA